MRVIELTFSRDPEATSDWEAARRYARELDAEAVADCGGSAFTYLIDAEALIEADESGGVLAHEASHLDQARKVLAADLDSLTKMIADPASAGSIPLANGDAIPAFEATGDDSFVARGPADPRDAQDRLTPYWRLTRLFDSGVMFDLGYE